MEPLPALMEAVLLTGNGGFECLSHRTDVAVPQPGPGEVLIKVGACGSTTPISTRALRGIPSPLLWRPGQAGAMALPKQKPKDSNWTGALPQFPRIQVPMRRAGSSR